MKPINEAAEMAALLLDVRRTLAKAEDIAAGRKARITLTNDQGDTRSVVVPFRVARYARKAMGAPALLPEGTLRLVFSSKGLTVALNPTIEGYVAVAEVIIAFQHGEVRRIKRAIARNERRMREHDDRPKKGGAAV